MEEIIKFFKTPLGINIITVVISIIAIIIISKLIKRIIPRHIEDTSSKYRARKFVNVIGYVSALVVTLVVFSSQLSALNVLLGVAGAGVAFAFQEVIASFAGYLVLHSSSFFKVGDRVMLGGIKGDVIDVGLLRTSLMETGDWINGDRYNGRITKVANSFIFKAPVHNYSGDFPFLWDEIQIPIKTHCDFIYAKEKFLEILIEAQGDFVQVAEEHWHNMTTKYLVEHARVDPFVFMRFDENWITLTLRYVVHYNKRGGTKDWIYERVLSTIRDSNGKLEVASAAMEITAFPK
ncbi:mechanosensitive ion channel family protein [Winogradskyella alexanderae]|uniref:Mechanosensitive ion channel family protein n=1 Tax=Winogradskyella alexanderae TaxID=2877123 RepID=A0ABS7XWW0_9FLAO|nr:mechanosensitive ion channel domain-containing protein [Winogradskyella alexanderae]MCA0133316.1 mechanosensitive ion channel family protein [Winogradskyella alexanderae]